MQYRYAIGWNGNCNNSQLRKIKWKIRPRKIWLTIGQFIVGSLFYAAISIISGPVTNYATPLFFPYRLVNGEMKIYSDSPIPEIYGSLAVYAKAVLARSPLYNDQMPLRIYICDKKWKYSFFGSADKETSGIFKADSGNIFISRHQLLDLFKFGKDKIIFNDHPTVNLLELKEVMIHEATHAVVFNALGKSGRALLPKWISEGYAEYMAKTKMTDLGYEVNIRLLNKMGPEKSAQSYRRYHLLVSYALDVKKIPLKQLLDNPPEQSDLEKELGLRSYSKSS